MARWPAFNSFTWIREVEYRPWVRQLAHAAWAAFSRLSTSSRVGFYFAVSGRWRSEIGATFTQAKSVFRLACIFVLLHRQPTFTVRFAGNHSEERVSLTNPPTAWLARSAYGRRQGVRIASPCCLPFPPVRRRRALRPRRGHNRASSRVHEGWPLFSQPVTRLATGTICPDLRTLQSLCWQQSPNFLDLATLKIRSDSSRFC